MSNQPKALYAEAKRLEALARDLEKRKQQAQRSARRCRERARAITHPWEVWQTAQVDAGNKPRESAWWHRIASFKTREAAEAALPRYRLKHEMGAFQVRAAVLEETRK